MHMELITGENDKGRRLDRILRKALSDHPLPLIHRLLRQGHVLVDGKPAGAQDRVDSGVKISIPALKGLPRQKSLAAKTGLFLPLEILWQGCGLIAVNKPPGLAVHGHDSLDTMVRSFLADKLPVSLSFMPGPLHRLDKPSSGIVVFSTSIEGARLFSSLMRERKVKKTYLALIEGVLEKEELWEDYLVRDRDLKKSFVVDSAKSSRKPLAQPIIRAEDTEEELREEEKGKRAVSMVRPLEVRDNLTLVEVQIETGRTHQIRAQAGFHGHPLAGDRKYGGHGNGGLFLHAWKIEFLDVIIEAPIPVYPPTIQIRT
jgi:23S rRNA pseudouridine955/2504/2580 synthase